MPDDEDYTKPHQWFQYASAPEGDPYCSGCQLPAENARHRGRFQYVITVNANTIEQADEEAQALIAFHYEGEAGDEVWLTTDRTWE